MVKLSKKHSTCNNFMTNNPDGPKTYGMSTCTSYHKRSINAIHLHVLLLVQATNRNQYKTKTITVKLYRNASTYILQQLISMRNDPDDGQTNFLKKNIYQNKTIIVKNFTKTTYLYWLPNKNYSTDKYNKRFPYGIEYLYWLPMDVKPNKNFSSHNDFHMDMYLVTNRYETKP
jgi:hypothetical protein